ncbi:class II aldolase/adducin family protein [Microvirga aerophila]|uniref:Class II aldolase/adducin N-terminal domain-containing protein n=1 Tax=Microvirga aerophila TaxID=670291 RepID=A0A512C1N2_9HYPH|nr:class II aldolase/adducin family protein [Microvirga aerophila]GEO18110.1 hypothetical protein MAE02_58060 [Microvirga aerophila]
MKETAAREAMVRLAKSLFDRGYSVGSSGNISMAVEDGLLITPTNSCLGFLDPARISKLDVQGRHVGGGRCHVNPDMRSSGVDGPA